MHVQSFSRPQSCELGSDQPREALKMSRDQRGVEQDGRRPSSSAELRKVRDRHCLNRSLHADELC